MCQGTAAACEKSLGASGADQINKVLNEVAKPCEIKDQELAQTISSQVSKVASIQTYMPESKADTTSTSNTPVVTTLTAEVAKPNANSNATVNAQEAITNAQITKVVTPEQHSDLERRFAEIEKQNKELVEKDKKNTLNNLFQKVKDEKVKEELVKKYTKFENVDQIKEIISELYPILRASEEDDKSEEDKPAEDNDTQAKKVKGKSASLPAEPVIPKEEQDRESKAASIPVNKLKEILRFQMSGGRA